MIHIPLAGNVDDTNYNLLTLNLWICLGTHIYFNQSRFPFLFFFPFLNGMLHSTASQFWGMKYNILRENFSNAP